mgnify:CR=1 FL=1
MREIKFREWETERKTMAYSNREDFDDSVNFRFKHEEGGKRILMQYTGLKDKNGKEIYEGDIVIVGQKETPAEVIFENGCFYTPIGISRYRLGGWNKESLEVIGNIFENPELLGGIK